MTSKHDVSVELIIPSYARTRRLIDTINDTQKLYPDLSIRVALQGENDTQKILDAVTRPQRVKVEHHEQPNLIGALNSAVRNSPAEICIILDDDAVPCSGWLEGHLDALLNNPECYYTYGREVNERIWRTPLSEVLRLTSELVFGIFVPQRMKLFGRIVGWTTRTGLVFSNFFLPGRCQINAPAEGNMGFRRAVFLDFGGFNEAFSGNCWGYGPELGFRMAQKGMLGMYVGDAVMIHRPHVGGGTRNRDRRVWYRQYVKNNRTLISTVGPLGWIGALPRLVRRYFVQ